MKRPGDVLKEMLNSLGIEKPKEGCNCDEWTASMNNGGINWCRKHKQGIEEQLRRSARTVGMFKKVEVAAKLVGEPWFNPLDPYGSLVEEALRRASVEEQPKN